MNFTIFYFKALRDEKMPFGPQAHGSHQYLNFSLEWFVVLLEVIFFLISAHIGMLP